MSKFGVWLVVIPCVVISSGCLLMGQLIYWYDACKNKLWLDNHLKREGQPIPERKGFWWWLFLRLRKKFTK